MSKLTLALLLTTTCVTRANTYCEPTDSCWPDASAWAQLSSDLGTGVLNTVADVSTVYSECSAAITAYGSATASRTANGTCIFAGACVYQGCNVTAGASNLPAYTVQATSTEHVQTAIRFAKSAQ